MKKILLFAILISFVFSCQKKESNKKHWPVASEHKSGKINKDSLKDKGERTVTITLPNNRYAVITLISDEENYKKNMDEDIPDALRVEWEKPKFVKIFDSKTKKELPETWLEGIYYSDNDDDNISYGDFNFDGKMDVVCPAKALSYRDFYTYNFYLATRNGYEFNKEFSEITEEPLAYLKLDAKKKTILAVREAEWDESWEYKVKNNELEEIRHTKDGRQKPFMYHYDSDADIPERTVLIYNDKFKVLSFTTLDEKKNILIFLDDDYTETTFDLYYAEMINDSLVSSYCFEKYSSDKFIYNQNKRTLQFEENNINYKIYENDSDFGIEITAKGKTTKLIGNPNSKIGSLSRIISLKRKESDFENIVIEK